MHLVCDVYVFDFAFDCIWCVTNYPCWCKLCCRCARSQRIRSTSAFGGRLSTPSSNRCSISSASGFCTRCLESRVCTGLAPPPCRSATILVSFVHLFEHLAFEHLAFKHPFAICHLAFGIHHLALGLWHCYLFAVAFAALRIPHLRWLDICLRPSY